MVIKTILAFTTGIFAILFVSSCTPSHVDIIAPTTQIPTFVTTMPTLTPTQIPTSTPRPTIEPTATKNPYEFDIEKFNNFPQSYKYLLAHPDEFVRGRDPLDDREAFDKWWTEVLFPAVGSRLDREVNINMGGVGIMDPELWSSPIGYNATVKMLSLPQFFYFENTGTKYPVLIINMNLPAGGTSEPGITHATMAIILCDGSPHREGTGAISRISKGDSIQYISILTKRIGEEDFCMNRFVDAGIIPVVDLTNDISPIMFGVGRILFYP